MNDNAKAWVAALRSGNYRQGIGKLKQNDRYCCLGVACELYQQAVGDLWVRAEVTGVTYYNNNNENLPDEVQKWLGLVSEWGANAADIEALTDKNDTGKSFAEIADIIESEPEGLFV